MKFILIKMIDILILLLFVIILFSPTSFSANLEWEAINAIKLNNGGEIHTLEDVENVEIYINIQNSGLFVFLGVLGNDHFSKSEALRKINYFKNKIILDEAEYYSIQDWYIKNCQLITTYQNNRGAVISEPIRHVEGTLKWLIPMQNDPSEVIIGAQLNFTGSNLGYIQNVSLPLHHYTCDCGFRSCTRCGPVYRPNNDTPDFEHYSIEENKCYSIKNQIQNARQPLNNWSNPGVPPLGPTFKVVYHDRTPPRIISSLPSVTGKFPNLIAIDGINSASTGDFYIPKLLRVVDNSGRNVHTAFVIKRETIDIDSLSITASWTITGNIYEGNSDSILASHVLIPNDVYGDMSYVVFAFDTKGNLNPGEPNILENMPEICYGVEPAIDLGKIHGSAQDFPYKVSTANLTEARNKICELIDQRVDLLEEKAGKIFVEDNDRPNILIKIQSSRDPNDMIFFPLPTKTNPNSFSGNYQGEYSNFVNGCKLFVEDVLSTSTPYFEIMSVSFSSNFGESPLLMYNNSVVTNIENIFTMPNSSHIMLKNFRLENYLKSDTNSEGHIIVDDILNIGERYGFGRKAVIKCNIPLIEDVEYIVSFWADDNVHYANYLGATQKSINGISYSNVRIIVPNQYPPIDINTHFNSNSRILGPFKIICREPTGETFSNLSNHPKIYVKVVDIRGNIRELEVYFKVTDEKTRIRILEQSNIRKN